MKLPAPLCLLLVLALSLPLAACDGSEPEPTPEQTGTTPAPTDPPPDDPADETGTDGNKRTEPLPVTQTWRGEGATLEFSIWHMHCSACEARARKALESIEGVTEVATHRDTDVVVLTLSDAALREDTMAAIPDVLDVKNFELVQAP